MRNAGLRFVCKPVALRVETTASAFTAAYSAGQVLSVPVAHHDGNYTADTETLSRLKGDDRIAFTYVENPNGSQADIAGVLSEKSPRYGDDATSGKGRRPRTRRYRWDWSVPRVDGNTGRGSLTGSENDPVIRAMTPRRATLF